MTCPCHKGMVVLHDIFYEIVKWNKFCDLVTSTSQGYFFDAFLRKVTSSCICCWISRKGSCIHAYKIHPFLIFFTLCRILGLQFSSAWCISICNCVLIDLLTTKLQRFMWLATPIRCIMPLPIITVYIQHDYAVTVYNTY